jgi:hypothetical protein
LPIARLIRHPSASAAVRRIGLAMLGKIPACAGMTEKCARELTGKLRGNDRKKAVNDICENVPSIFVKWTMIIIRFTNTMAFAYC